MSDRHLGWNKCDNGIQPKYPLSPYLLERSKTYIHEHVYRCTYIWICLNHSDWEMGMKGHDKDYTTILNLPKENDITFKTDFVCENVRKWPKIMTLLKPPLPWREQIEKSRRIRSSFSWEDFSDHQHKSRLQVFQVSFFILRSRLNNFIALGWKNFIRSRWNAII